MEKSSSEQSVPSDGSGGGANSSRSNPTNHNRIHTPTFVPTMRDMTKSHMDGIYSDDSFISAGISPRPSNMSANSTQLNPTVQLRVNDILKVNPLESEAETLILKAIERQDAIAHAQQSRSRANTESGSLLGNIPAEAINIFAPDEKRKDTFDEYENLVSPSTSFDRANSRPPRPPPPPPPSISRPSSQLPKPTFARNKTTEETLAALTMAMENFQEHPDDHHAAQLQNNSHVQSAAAAFAQNANIVFRGPAVTTKPPVSPKRDNHATSQQTNSSNMMSQPSSQASDGLKNSDTNIATASSAISPNWMKLKNAVKSSTVAELNGIDLTEGDLKGSDFIDPLDDVEIGQELPFDEQYNNNTAGNTNEDETQPNSTRVTSTRSNINKNSLYQVMPKGAVQDLQLFINQRRRSLLLYTRILIILIIPALTVSCLLFYFFDNVSTGKVNVDVLHYNGTLINTDGYVIDKDKASVSWWILFVCVRQALTFSIAQSLQVLIIDFLCLNTRFFTTIFGNLITLLIAQSRGWPFIAFTWGLINFAVLQGPSKFADSWLYWQDVLEVFNETNPGGSVTDSVWNTRILLIAISVGVTVAMKRLWLGLFLGKKTYVNHAEELTNVVKKALLLCEVATLARDFYYNSNGGGGIRRGMKLGMTHEALSVILKKSMPASEENDADQERQSLVNDDELYSGGLIVDSRRSDLLRGHLDQSQRMRISELLGAWEEPEAEGDSQENVTITSILQFRNSLTLLDSDFMFGIAWGDVSTRTQMVVSSQEVYQRLLIASPDSDILKFEILARVAMEQDGKTLNLEKLEALIRLLRPDRDGNLSLLDFVKSTDVVYKEAKLLRASIKNSEHIDRAFEKAFNVAFYTVMTCIILSRIGIDPIALFLSLSGLILAFAFMIGSASAKMFEGFLFILVRRPYNIGDRIHISNVESDTDPTGSAGWIVKDVNLFNTTLIYGATNERATIANGSLSSSRVINMARSPKACISIDLKFATDAPYERIKVFEQSLRDFVKARPREWANFNGFRAGTIRAESGYIEYTVSLSHREAWQNIVTIVNSKAEVAAFCLELSKQLNLPVNTPALPVNLTFMEKNANPLSDKDSQAGSLIRGFGGTGHVTTVDANDE